MRASGLTHCQGEGTARGKACPCSVQTLPWTCPAPTWLAPVCACQPSVPKTRSGTAPPFAHLPGWPCDACRPAEGKRAWSRGTRTDTSTSSGPTPSPAQLPPLALDETHVEAAHVLQNAKHPIPSPSLPDEQLFDQLRNDGIYLAENAKVCGATHGGVGCGWVRWGPREEASAPPLTLNPI